MTTHYRRAAPDRLGGQHGALPVAPEPRNHRVAGSRPPGRLPPPRRERGAPDDENAVGRRRRVDLTLICLATLAYTTSPTFVNVVLGGRVAGNTLSTGAVAETPLGAVAFTAASYLLPAVELFVILRNLRSAHRNSGPLLLVIGVWSLVQMSTWIADGSVSIGPRFFVLPLLAVAVWSINVRLDDLRVIGSIAGLVALVALGYAIVSERAWMPDFANGSTESKAIVGSRLLAGPFAQMNVLGLSMAAGLPFAFLVRRRSLRVLSVLAIATALVLSSSRTSVIAALMCLVVAAVVHRSRTERMRRRVSVVGFTTILTAIVVLPLETSDAAAFNTRGAIWIESIATWPEHMVLGQGTGAYRVGSEIFSALGTATYHGHNLFVSAMSMGGILLVAAMLSLLVVTFRRALHLAEHSVAPVLLVLTVTALGLAEVPLRLDDFDGPSWVTWPAFLAVLLLDPGPAPSLLDDTARRVPLPLRHSPRDRTRRPTPARDRSPRTRASAGSAGRSGDGSRPPVGARTTER